MHRSLCRIRRTQAEYTGLEKGKGINKKAMHGLNRLQGRHGLSALAKRAVIKWICLIKKELKSSAGAYGMINGGL